MGVSSRIQIGSVHGPLQFSLVQFKILQGPVQFRSVQFKILSRHADQWLFSGVRSGGLTSRSKKLRLPFYLYKDEYIFSTVITLLTVQRSTSLHSETLTLTSVNLKQEIPRIIKAPHAHLHTTNYDMADQSEKDYFNQSGQVSENAVSDYNVFVVYLNR